MSRADLQLHSLQAHDLELLRVFRTIVQAGGLTASEVDLGLERSTISRHLKALEVRLGATLCHRGPKGFRLTEFGKDVYNVSVLLEDAIEDVRSHLNRSRFTIRGELKLGISDACLSNPNVRLAEAISAFLRDVPDVRISVETGTPSNLVQLTTDGFLHACVVGLPVDGSRLNAHDLFEEEFALYMSATLLGRVHSIDDLKELGMGIVLRETERAFESRITRKLDLDTDASAKGIEAIATLVATGRFVGLLPRHTVAGIAGDRHAFVEVPGSKHLAVKRRFALVSDAARPPTRVLKRFKEEVVVQHSSFDFTALNSVGLANQAASNLTSN